MAVVASTEDGYKKFVGRKGIIMATGDISGNGEMCERYSPLMIRCEQSQYIPEGANQGEGQQMGLWIGAKLKEGPFSPMIHPQAYLQLSQSFLFVNTRGNRFMNEDTWGQGKSLGVLNTEGNTFEELAEAIAADEPDFDKAAFVAEAERYNELCRNGKDVDFGKRDRLLYEIKNPPYYAAKFGPCRMVAPGGMLINTKSEVLGEDDRPIPGLYAVGNCSGGLYSVDYPLVILGNSHGRCVTFGYLLGRQLTGVE